MSQCRRRGEEDSGEEKATEERVKCREKKRERVHRNEEEKKKPKATDFQRKVERNKLGRNKCLKQSGLPLVLPYFIVCPPPAPGRDGQDAFRAGWEDGRLQRVLLPLSSQHLTSWHTLFLSMSE